MNEVFSYKYEIILECSDMITNNITSNSVYIKLQSRAFTIYGHVHN